MSKRFIFPQQSGDRKKPRLEISVSDHNFPLSQNAGSCNAVDHFDEIDDELLLQASQACEQACNASMLPAYSQFMPPALASTQLPEEPSSSTSKRIFSFKKPTAGQTITISTNLKDKCDRISSPLRGIASNVTVPEIIDLTENYFNDKVLNTQDNDYVYRQLLQLKEENAKLKSENGKLLEKCVTKEGEASILRTQLKTCQLAVDNARLEKIKTHEQAQIQWSEKLHAVNKQLSDVKTQLDSKNLVIIGMKERCKMLESNKVKLTQITVAGNEMSRVNNSMFVSNSFMASQARKTASATVQTDSNQQFLKLSKPCRLNKTSITQILPLIMDSAADHQHSILDYNEKLKRPSDFSPNKSRLLNSFYRPSPHTDYVSSTPKVKINISFIYEDLMCIASCNNDVGKAQQHYVKLLDTTRTVLEGVQGELEMISKRLTTAFLKEMDKKYMEATTTYLVVTDQDLIAGKVLFKEEQAVLARRLTAVLRAVLADATVVRLPGDELRPHLAPVTTRLCELADLMCRICSLLDNNRCGLAYSGLLLAMLGAADALARQAQLAGARAAELVRLAASCRGALCVAGGALRLARGLRRAHAAALCGPAGAGDSGGGAEGSGGRGGGNLKVDHDQGVLLFKKDSCVLLVLLRQLEAAIKAMEQERLGRQVVTTARHLLQLYSNIGYEHDERPARCKCENLFVQVLVYALKICSTMLEDPSAVHTESSRRQQAELLGVCRSGLQALYRCSLRDAEFAAQLDYNEGNLLQFCERLNDFEHNEFYGTMLSELLVSLQPAEGGGSAGGSSPLRLAWLSSFESFSLTD